MSTRLEGARRPRRTPRRSRPRAARRRGRSTRWPQVMRTPSAAIRSSSRVEHVAGQPVGRDAVAHHPAGLVAGVADLDLVAEPGQVVGGRQPARPGADDQHPLAAADRRARRTPSPAPARDRRGSARPSGSRPRCRARPGCRRSRRGGSRPARGSPGTGCRRRAAARPARARRPRRAPARPGCSRRPGSRRCTAAADRRRRAAAPAPARCASARAAGRAAASGPLVRSYRQPGTVLDDKYICPGLLGPPIAVRRILLDAGQGYATPRTDQWERRADYRQHAPRTQSRRSRMTRAFAPAAGGERGDALRYGRPTGAVSPGRGYGRCAGSRIRWRARHA